MEGIATFLLLAAVLLFYFIPTMIACVRNCQHSGTIFFINLIFGWTVLGWIAALIWAIAEKPEAPVVRAKPQTDWSEPFYK